MSSANPATTLGGQWERIGEGNFYTSPIIDVVKTVNGWAKMSQKRYDKLNRKLVNFEYEVDSDGNIRNLAEIVKI